MEVLLANCFTAWQWLPAVGLVIDWCLECIFSKMMALALTDAFRILVFQKDASCPFCPFFWVPFVSRAVCRRVCMEIENNLPDTD
jgi:hypothetical protein